ncbi:T9SS type A sorting domain-containing protein [Hymenobacter sedentarius]|uniref:T9SS type A sorting domain-containing protein n=1 Tax=Hymenobacter sedentarius TaxID=1411621 RepID=UPI0018EEC3D5|nr:T9SS type A sorting domain-containing protein [Hymenobacter sedentarius]
MTYTQGGYGAEPHGNNPGTIVRARFETFFPNDLIIGCTGTGGHTIRLTSAAAVAAFLPSGSNPGVLTQNYVDPTKKNGNSKNNGPNSYSSEFAGQLVALTLSVAFSPNNLGSAVITSGTFAGLTVNQLLVIANNVYGGCSTQYSLSQLNDILTAINEGYDEGHRSNILSCPPACTLALGTPTITNVSCFGGNTGAFTISATGGTTFSYAIARVTGGVVGTYGTAQSSGTFSNLAAGTYSVRVTSGNCTATRLVTITQPLSALGITTVGVVNATCTATGSITVTAAGGTAPYTYQLGSGAIGTSNVFTGLAPGSYTVTVRDASGCTTTRTNVAVLGVPGNLVVTLSNLVNATCTNNGSATLSASGGAAPYFFSLTMGSTTLTSTTGIFNNLAPGTYQVLVRDANGCTATCAAIVILGTPAIISLTSSQQVNVSCFGGTNGSVQLTAVGGTAPYTYTLDARPTNTTGIFTGLAAGTYAISVRDANGCTATGTAVVITQPAVLGVTLSNLIDANCSTATGSATLTATGGTGPFTFTLTRGTQVLNLTTTGTNRSVTFTGLAPGTYQVLVTDANGCTATCAAIVIQGVNTITGLVASAVTNVSCFGANNGSVTLTVAGGAAPFTFRVDGQTIVSNNSTVTFTGLAPGTNIPISVTSGSCVFTGTSINITQPVVLGVTLSNLVNATCTASTGSVTLAATGGTGPYTYTLTMGSTVRTIVDGASATFLGLAPGIYQVLVTDARGCTATCAAIEILGVNNITALTETAITNVTCFGANNGRVTLTVAGGSAPFTFTVDARTIVSNDRTVTFTNLAPGTNIPVSVTSGTCTFAGASINITQPAALGLGQTIVTNASCAGLTGSVTTQATGGTAPYTYSLLGPGVRLPQGPTAGAVTFSGLGAGTYSVRVVDANGCEFTGSSFSILGVNAITTLSAVGSPIVCFGTNSGSVTLAVAGGTAPFTYTLVGPGGTIIVSDGSSVTFQNLAPGTYTGSVRDVNGCTATANSVTITQPAAALQVIFGATVNACNDAFGRVFVSASGGTAPYTYRLSLASAPNPVVASSGAVADGFTFTGLTANNYLLTVTDARGCTAVCPTQLQITNACTSSTSSALTASSGGTLKIGSADVSLQVYPNPVRERATVEFRVAEGQSYSVAIYDMVGRVVRNVTKGVGEANHTYQVPVSLGLEDGMYLVRLTTGNTVKTARLNVQK